MGEGDQEGEVVDCSTMNVAALETFVKKTAVEAKQEGVLLSLHMKATMMKVSDPIVFGHVVHAFYEEAFTKHADTFKVRATSLPPFPTPFGWQSSHAVGSVHGEMLCSDCFEGC